ncbi:MAG TPA: HD domain-containing phosphohydrolase [Acidimicrobiales bacterium]|nr:HD domain-containing phosphohydrolase [Acidimicrobiales bacterium]
MDSDERAVAPDSPLRTLEYLGEFLDSTTLGFAYFDQDGVIRDCNQALAHLLDATIDELLGRNFFDPDWATIHEDGTHFRFDNRNDATTFQTGQAHTEIIMGFNFKGAPRRWLSVNTYPVFAEGTSRGVISSFTDITKSLQRDRMLELVNEVNHSVMLASDEGEALQHLCDTLIDKGRFALAWIGVASNEDVDLVEIAFAAGATEYLDSVLGASGDARNTARGPAGAALRHAATQVVNDLGTDPFFEPWRERAVAHGLGSMAVMPLSPGGRRAVLAVYDHHVFAFDEVTVRELEEAVGEVEFGVAHVLSVKQLSTALDGTLAALARITENRDPYTAGHQARVGALGAAIATHMGLETTLVELIRQSGEVHDVGKTAIPSEILTRPGRLSALEFEMVQRHCALGADILTRASLPWPIAEVALQHHERMDGSGYPHGLGADDIVLPARIIAVADVVEAMMHHRPYRPGLGLERALEEIRAHAGTLYDETVVESCLAVFANGFEIDDVESAP